MRSRPLTLRERVPRLGELQLGGLWSSNKVSRPEKSVVKNGAMEGVVGGEAWRG